MKKIETFKIAELVEDFAIYPRAQVDDNHVTALLYAMEAGVKLPPPVIDRKKHRIVDGMHTKRACRRFFGDDARIACEVRDYHSDADLFIDAMRLNSAHGRNLTNFDKITAITRAETLEIAPECIATALNMKIERVLEMKTSRVATVKGTSREIPIKRTVSHMAGQELTATQVEAMPKIGGLDQSFYVNQIIILIDSDLLNVKDKQLMSRCKMLYDKLGEVLKKAKG